jgi:hypothetical protein
MWASTQTVRSSMVFMNSVKLILVLPPSPSPHQLSPSSSRLLPGQRCETQSWPHRHCHQLVWRAAPREEDGSLWVLLRERHCPSHPRALEIPPPVSLFILLSLTSLPLGFSILTSTSITGTASRKLSIPPTGLSPPSLSALVLFSRASQSDDCLFSQIWRLLPWNRRHQVLPPPILCLSSPSLAAEISG